MGMGMDTCPAVHTFVQAIRLSEERGVSDEESQPPAPY